MAATLGKGSQERNDKKYSQGSSNKASYMKRDAELKKIFGLTKDLRVCLTRIPEHLGSGKVSDFFRSSVKNSTYKEAEIMVKAEEKKQQGFDKKRKAKTIKKMKYTERKTKSAVSTVINGATNVTSSQLLSSTLPLSDISQHDISHSKTREEKRTELEHCSCEKQEKGACSSSAAFEESSSVNKNYMEDIFLATAPELEETIRDEKIRRLKHVLREKEAALEEMRKKMHKNKKKVF